MLTFFATLLVNVLIGTIFYLVISLRIEKSASEIHVKKIRKEMDDMIREFNVTADRNISLLENRIAVMQRLLEKGGAESIDLTVDEAVKPTTVERAQNVAAEIPAAPLKEYPSGLGGVISQSTEFIRSIGTGLRQAIHDVNTIRQMEKEKAAAGTKDRADEEKPEKKSSHYVPSSVIVKDEKDVLEIFSGVTDRKDAYAIASKLYEEGYSVESIAHLSGIPAGEISLVVQLRSR